MISGLMNGSDAYTASKSIVDAKQAHAPVVVFDNHSKPREERDFKEIYPDLDDHSQLNVFVLRDQEDNNTDNLINNTGSNYSYNIDLKKPVFKKLELPATTSANIKFNKAITDYGYQVPSKSKPTISTDSYLRPFQVSSNIVPETIENFLEKKQRLVEYDMDEQDYVYLKARNESSKNIIKIYPEVFEIMMTTLEIEWDKLDHKMNSIMNSMADMDSDDPNKLLSLERNIEKYGSDDGIIPGSIYDQKCAVCNDSDCDNSNAIVFCDGCDIAVHQECYGIAFIPEGQWLCRKCMINKNRKTDCVFCPSKTGAFKQLDNSLWSHVICGLWINELYFANPIYMEPIEGMDLIPKSRWKLSCYICKQRVGACIQCINRNCFQAYHATCARRAGLYMEMTQGIQGALANKTTLKTYCDKHGPPDYDSSDMLTGIHRTRMFYRDTKILNEENDKLSINKKNANKLNVFKWKTEANTPIAPKLFSDILLNILIDLKVENQVFLPDQNDNQVKGLNRLPNRSKQETREEMREICNEICRYWCLKREQKNGAPLIRKNNNLLSTNSILYNTLDGNSFSNIDHDLANGIQLNEIKDRITFAEVLVKDLQKIIGLSNYTLERQQLLQNLNEVDFQMIDSIYFPIKKIIETFLTTLNDKFDNNKIIQNYKFKGGNTNRQTNNENIDGIIVQNKLSKYMQESDDVLAYNVGSQQNIILKESAYSPMSGKLGMSQILHKIYAYEYTSVKQFEADIEQLYHLITIDNRPGATIIKVMKKWIKEFHRDLPSLFECENKILSRSNLSNSRNQNKNIVVDYRNLQYLNIVGNEPLVIEDEDIEIEDLTDVEDELTNHSENQLIFERFLKG